MKNPWSKRPWLAYTSFNYRHSWNDMSWSLVHSINNFRIKCSPGLDNNLKNLKMGLVQPTTPWMRAIHATYVRDCTPRTWIDGFDVRRRDMPIPSNASLQVPSERIFQSPLDFPNSLVCIFEDAVSKGCKVKP